MINNITLIALMILQCLIALGIAMAYGVLKEIRDNLRDIKKAITTNKADKG